MSEIKGMRFGKRDKQGRLKVIIPKNSEIEINGAKATLRSTATVFVVSHEDANKILGVEEEKSEEGVDK